MLKRAALVTLPLLALAASQAYAEEDLSGAREALAKQESDADTERALEEVFQAAEKSYSLLRRGEASLNFNSDYTYYGDQRIDLTIIEGSIKNADVNDSASHTFTNAFTLDYGLRNNLTGSIRLPLVAKYDTDVDITSYGLGDISTSLRWQPFEYVPGRVSQTYFGSISLKTGDSPYEINRDRHLSTGSGYYSFTFGGSFSKVIDPVVLFGSASYSYNLKETGLNQANGASLLQSIDPGSAFGFSMGFAYSLSYDVSLSASFQGSYNDKTEFGILYAERSVTSKSGSQMSGIMNFALGVRTSPKNIVNVNVGFGVTELSPDIILGLSLPISLEGIKPSSSR